MGVVSNEKKPEKQIIKDKVFKERPSRKTTEQIYQLKRDLLDVKRACRPWLKSVIV